MIAKPNLDLKGNLAKHLVLAGFMSLATAGLAVFVRSGIAFQVFQIVRRSGQPDIQLSEASDAAGLFIVSSTHGDLNIIEEPFVTRHRLVSVNLDLLTTPDGSPDIRPGKGEVLILNLFNDVTLRAVLDRVEAGSDNHFIWVGHIEDVEHSHVTLTVSPKSVFGDVTVPGKTYWVRPTNNSVHAIYEVDPRAFPPDAPPIQFDISE